jgi:hypothetical protein
LSRAFDAPADSMWTSSTMYTFVRPLVPSDARWIRSRIAVDAVVRCGVELGDRHRGPASTARHGSHTPHGSPSWRSSQFRAFARIRAVEVLPVPRGPLNR